MRNFLRLFTLLVAVTLVGCGASLPTIKPYKMDIQQGNVVTSEMLLKLRPSMTKSQVQFIMGTPLLVDSFHSNRWDYFYQLRKDGKIVNQRRVILDFENDLLKRVRGDVVPKGMTAEDVAKKLEAEAAQESQPEDAPAENTDAAEPIIKRIDAPEVEAVKPAADVADEKESAVSDEVPNEVSESTDAPASIIAVPIPVVPEVTAPKADVQVEAPEPVQTPSKKSVDEMAADTKGAADAAVNEDVPDAQAPVVVSPVENASDVMESPSTDAKDTDAKEKRVFRMDRQLDQESTPSPAPAQESAVQEVKESQDKELLDEEDPGFFERMLEKIGF